MKTLRPWRKSTLQVVTVEHWRGLVVKEGESETDGSESVKEEPKEKEEKVDKRRSSKECFTKWAGMGLMTKLKLCR